MAGPSDVDARPLCCGRTYLAAGLVDEAKREASRALTALAPYAQAGIAILGLEPSCLFTFRDEIPAYGLGSVAQTVAQHAMLFEEFISREHLAGRLKMPFGEVAATALLHGHCHQKAFAAMGAAEATLRLVPGLRVEMVESSCCGMAGAFGYQAETAEISKAMGELSLLPAVRAAAPETLIVAGGTSCRHQISHGTDRTALHVVQVLAMSVKAFAQRCPTNSNAEPKTP